MPPSDLVLRRASELISQASYLVALTGAGISSESNVPTFRGVDGMWRNHNAEELATPHAFLQNPKLVWEWYTWRQTLIRRCSPNPAHLTLAAWEERSILKHLITQNVDDLHYRDGSRQVAQVHGDIFRIKCTGCDYVTTLEKPEGDTPHCPKCGSNLRPDVVWFGESLDSYMLDRVCTELGRTDAIIIVGASGVVQPAASFPLIVKRNAGSLIETNIEMTPLSGYVDFHVQGKAGSVLPEIDSLL
jgi:NAD-dependent deacetylase